MLVSIIVAVSENGVIGRDNQLPWRLPEDLRRFKALSMGKPMIMGRRTFDSIGRALPGRRSIVISRRPGLRLEGCTVVDSLDAALALAQPAPEAVVIGGADIYRLALPHVSRVYLTRVHAQIEGDTRFVDLKPGEWREVDREYHPADDRHAWAYSFITLERTVR
jgi:dihydrofolate reductase